MTPMGPLHRFQVLPLHHQVGICDADATDVPEWETGQEPLVADQRCALVATRGDLGPVELEVWVGAPATPPPGPLLYEGELLTSGKGVQVGDLVAGDGHLVELAAGRHRLRIYADQPGNASRLRVVFDHSPERSPQAAPPANPRPPA
jgi:hypothetical protein